MASRFSFGKFLDPLLVVAALGGLVVVSGCMSPFDSNAAVPGVNIPGTDYIIGGIRNKASTTSAAAKAAADAATGASASAPTKPAAPEAPVTVKFEDDLMGLVKYWLLLMGLGVLLTLAGVVFSGTAVGAVFAPLVERLGLVFAGTGLLMLCITFGLARHAEILGWTVLAGILAVLAVVAVWLYKRLHETTDALSGAVKSNEKAKSLLPDEAKQTLADFEKEVHDLPVKQRLKDEALKLEHSFHKS